MTRLTTAILTALFIAGCAGNGPAPAEFDLTTLFERSEGARTPRHAETVAWCRALAAASPQVEYTTFGTSPQGRELPLLIADRRGRFTPEAARRDDGVVLLVEACIHAGECCGKDAGMMLLRDLAMGEAGLPENVTLLFIPIFSVDGHERFGPRNRVNQNGPEEMGWRTTASNLNLNRDFLKADTPEMQAWLKLWTAWLPDFFVDIHSTDGADYQYALTYSLEIRGNLDPDLTAWTRDRYLATMETEMADGGFPIQTYCFFKRRHDPRSGLRTWVSGPRFSQGYAAIHNRPGLLIETHMMKPYVERVRSTYLMLEHTIALLDEDHSRLRALNLAADARAASPAFRESPLPLTFHATDDSVMIDFLGVEYDEVESEISGGSYMDFHADRPTTFRVPLFGTHEPDVMADLPEAYLIPPEWTEVIARLELNGVTVRRLAEPTDLDIETWRFSDPEWRDRPYEGRFTVRAEQVPLSERRLYPAGTAVVDMNQRTARLIAHALEPRGPDSFLQWGFFAPIFSRTEYIEDYVIEAMMPGILADDPEMAAELEARKAADPDFAANPWAIRYWVYARTPWYDQRHNIYPVGRLLDRTAVAGLPLAESD